jgi:transposase
MGTTMTKKTRRTFSREYKAEVLALVRQADGNASKVARNIGLAPQLVAGWVRQEATDAGRSETGHLTTTERAELSALRKEVKDLKMEREFLKKTAKWFARESQ